MYKDIHCNITLRRQNLETIFMFLNLSQHVPEHHMTNKIKDVKLCELISDNHQVTLSEKPQ